MAGQIIARGKSTWLCRIHLPRDPQTGSRRYLSHTVHGTKNDAQAWLNEKLRARDLGTPLETSRATLQAFLQAWLKDVCKPKISPKTWKGYSELMEKWIINPLGSRPLGKIQSIELQSAFAKMNESGLSARTQEYCRMILRSAFRYAVETKLLVFDPSKAITIPRVKRREMKVLNPEQVRKLLAIAALDESYFHPMFSLAVSTGMRVGEFLGLKWSDIDFKNGTASVQRSVDLIEGEWVFSDCKTALSKRRIQLTEEVIDLLRIHKDKSDEIRKNSPYKKMDLNLVFCTSVGTPISRLNVRRRLWEYIEKVNESIKDEHLKLPRIRVYDLRHTFATIAMPFIPIKIISQMLGHSNAAMTLNVYQSVLPHHQKDAAIAIGALLRTPVEAKSVHTIGTHDPKSITEAIQ